MGFLDFLYKKPERPENFRGPRYRSAPSPASHHHSHHYQKRTALHVNSNRPSSSQDDDYYSANKRASYQGQANNNGRQQQSNNQHRQSHYRNNQNGYDKSNAIRGGSSNSSTADDYTRLSRLEIRIDNYIKRYNEISDELAHIEANLAQIYLEFEDDFKENIVDKSNKYTVEVGNRVLDKLSPYNHRSGQNNNNNNNDKNNGGGTDSVDAHPITTTITNVEYEPLESKQIQDQVIYSHPNKKTASNHHNGHSENNNNNNNREIEVKTKSRPAKNDDKFVSDYNGHNNDRHHNHHNKNDNLSTLNQNEDFSFNITEIPHNNGKSIANNNRDSQLVRAHYAIVNSTPYSGNDQPVRPGNHYQSTPTIPQTGQSAVPLSNNYGTMSQYDINQNYQSSPSPSQYSSSQVGGPESGRQSKLYLNMSSAMHSNHPAIDNCFRYIEMLRPRIMGYKSEHKLRVYQEMDKEIMYLMDRLDTIDCTNDETFLHERKIAKCELHNLTGILERSIECNDPECSICNVIVYKQEVSV